MMTRHTIGTRELDGLWGMCQWLDRAPKGFNETGIWWLRHDEYDKREARPRAPLAHPGEREIENF